MRRGDTTGRRVVPVLVVTLLLLLGGSAGTPVPRSPGPSPEAAGSPTGDPAPAESGRPAPAPASPDRPRASGSGRAELVVPYRVEVRTAELTTADVAAVVHAVLTDPRGWVRAGFRFVRDADAAYAIVLADGDEVDRLCRPYDTGGAYSCQNGPVVALNADRWRVATPEWPGDLAGYRTMLINHEVGHLLHLHHPQPQCPGPGLPAPVMAQQSSGPGECLAHVWPLRWEVELAARRREPLAPPAHHDVSDHRPTPPPARS